MGFKILLLSLICGFLIALLYEIVYFVKKNTFSFVFLHIALDFAFFFITFSLFFMHAFENLEINKFIFSFAFLIAGFALEQITLHFLFDKIYDFIYTIYIKCKNKLRKSKFGRKIYK